MKKVLNLLVVCLLVTVCLSGCSPEDEAYFAEHKLARDANNFNIYRKIKIINCQSNETILEFKGWCTIYKNNGENQLEITYRVGDDEYYKNIIGLNDRTTYIVTQIDAENVDKYHYEWLYPSEDHQGIQIE